MRNAILDGVEKQYLKTEALQFEVGDTVDVATKIKEGDKERIQTFSVTVIMKKGVGMNEMFTVRRIVNNEGVERIFPTNSPAIAGVTVKRSGETRRAMAATSTWAKSGWSAAAQPEPVPSAERTVSV